MTKPLPPVKVSVFSQIFRGRTTYDWDLWGVNSKCSVIVSGKKEYKTRAGAERAARKFIAEHGLEEELK